MTALKEQAEVPLTNQNVAASDPPGANLAGPFDLAQIVARHQADVWRYLRYLGAELADADDLTQETFLALNRSKFEERSRCETAAYLRTIARNQLLMFRRLQGREVDTVRVEAAEQVWAETVNESSMDTILGTLLECMETLEGRAREAIRLFYRENLSRTAMAAAMSMKPDGVKTLLRRTRDLLRDCIERKTNANRA